MNDERAIRDLLERILKVLSPEEYEKYEQYRDLLTYGRSGSFHSSDSTTIAAVMTPSLPIGAL